jgi:cell division protein ZapA (FtsZ GTPase activity inhibitor)
MSPQEFVMHVAAATFLLVHAASMIKSSWPKLTGSRGAIMAALLNLACASFEAGIAAQAVRLLVGGEL